MGSEQGLSRVREVTNYKKWEGRVGPCETHLSHSLALVEIRLLPSQRGWEMGPYPQVSLEQTGTILLAALSFLRQAL